MTSCPHPREPSARRAQTAAGREAWQRKHFETLAAARGATPDELRRVHMRELALRSARARRQRRLEKLQADAAEFLFGDPYAA